MRTLLLAAALCMALTPSFSAPGKFRKGTLPAQLRSDLRDATKLVRWAKRYVVKIKPLQMTNVSKPQADLRNAFARLHMAIRDQGSRGTCSIFAVMTCLQFVMAEKLHFVHGDFSPEYLNYVKNLANGMSTDGGFFSEIDKGYTDDSIYLEAKVPYKASFDPSYVVPPSFISAARKWPRLHSDFVKDWDNTKGATDDEVNDACAYLDDSIPIASGMLWPVDGAFKTTMIQGVDMMVTPQRSDVEDGHSIVLVGYKRSASFPGGGYFIFRNSWGTGFGDQGYGFMPFKYVKSYCNDMVVYKP